MFAKSVALAGQYTRPVVISSRLENKEVTAGLATFVVINDAGWIMTAAHVFQGFFLIQQHAKEKAQYTQALDMINSNPSFSSGKKKHEISKLVHNQKWITNQSMWFCVDGIGFSNAQVDFAADLAIAQLTGPVDRLKVTGFPRFANAQQPILQGTSLCRLGFPFIDIKATFDEASQAFSLPGIVQVAAFPNDGIFTRNVKLIDSATKREINFLETSSAGLRGQSGGPIFDTNANVWAIQSRTNHMPLGFSPTVKIDGKEIVEHQFMHCGLGVSVLHVREMLDKFNVAYQLA
jgi:hypothetical protein